jgi:hypothetical protein
VGNSSNWKPNGTEYWCNRIIRKQRKKESMTDAGIPLSRNLKKI